MNASTIKKTILCGNKLDCASQRQVSFEEAYNVALQNQLYLIEASARTGENVEKIFQQIGEMIWIT